MNHLFLVFLRPFKSELAFLCLDSLVELQLGVGACTLERALDGVRLVDCQQQLPEDRQEDDRAHHVDHREAVNGNADHHRAVFLRTAVAKHERQVDEDELKCAWYVKDVRKAHVAADGHSRELRPHDQEAKMNLDNENQVIDEEKNHEVKSVAFQRRLGGCAILALILEHEEEEDVFGLVSVEKSWKGEGDEDLDEEQQVKHAEEEE